MNEKHNLFLLTRKLSLDIWMQSKCILPVKLMKGQILKDSKPELITWTSNECLFEENAPSQHLLVGLAIQAE